MPMADIKGPSFVRRSPASSRRSTLRSSSDPTPPKGSWCCPNAGWWKEPWRGSGDAAGWPRTGNVSTTRRAHSCSSPRSALWSEGYAAPNYVSGQTLRHDAEEIDLKTGLQSITNDDTSVGALLHKHNGLHYSLGLGRA